MTQADAVAGKRSPVGSNLHPGPFLLGNVHRCLLPLLVALSASAALPRSGTAQLLSLGRVSVEPRLGVAFPLGDFGNIDPACPSGSSGCPFPVQVGTETGWRWGARATYAVRPRWTMVWEFGRTSLRCSTAFCGPTHSPGIKSFDVGFRVIPLSVGGMDVWLEGAGVAEEVTIIRTQDREGNRDPAPVAYPWSVGFSGGIGAELPLRGEYDLFFTPGFRFRYVPSDPPSAHADLDPVTATYVLLEVGFRVLFRG